MSAIFHSQQADKHYDADIYEHRDTNSFNLITQRTSGLPIACYRRKWEPDPVSFLLYTCLERLIL